MLNSFFRLPVEARFLMPAIPAILLALGLGPLGAWLYLQPLPGVISAGLTMLVAVLMGFLYAFAAWEIRPWQGPGQLNGAAVGMFCFGGLVFWLLAGLLAAMFYLHEIRRHSELVCWLIGAIGLVGLALLLSSLGPVAYAWLQRRRSLQLA